MAGLEDWEQEDWKGHLEEQAWVQRASKMMQTATKRISLIWRKLKNFEICHNSVPN